LSRDADVREDPFSVRGFVMFFRSAVCLTASLVYSSFLFADSLVQGTQIAIRVEAAGTGATGQAASGQNTLTPGARASGDLEISTDKSYTRLRFNSGIQSYELRDAGLGYANMVLQPDIRGFSFAADGWYNYYREKLSEHRFTCGGSLRVSGLTAWTVTKDPATGKDLPRQLSDNATVVSRLRA
jgi:hypothetical protein